jgi:pyruvate formate-lyase activating enzyme-like uncharacterized protein
MIQLVNRLLLIHDICSSFKSDNRDTDEILRIIHAIVADDYVVITEEGSIAKALKTAFAENSHLWNHISTNSDELTRLNQ